MRAALAVALLAVPCGAAELLEVRPLTDRIIELRVVDGHGVYPGAGEMTPERIEEAPLDVGRAASATGWRIASPDDPAYRRGLAPLRAGRASKGRDYVIETVPAWKPRGTLEHRLWLVLPRPLRAGAMYRVRHGDLGATLAFDSRRTRSAAVHASQLAYEPAAPGKFAYVSCWMGDLGPLDLAPYAGGRFRVLDAATRREVFAGRLALRRKAAQAQDGLQPGEASHVKADVWECDFSALTAPGEYVVSVDGIGCSYPFRIAPDAYRGAFRAVMQGMYQQRCGTALLPPHTAWTRSLCHHPSQHPIRQSTLRYMEGHCDACKETRGTRETRDVWGGYHDAGDWDREGSHPDIPAVLAMAYALNPSAFTDGELSIPESGNGLPDILDEARWGLDYYVRVQRPDGGVSVGLFMDSFPQAGEGPAADTGEWFCYASDPQASYKFAASACHVAHALERAGRPALGPPYVAAARNAWAWAEKHQRPGDAKAVRDDRLHAAAALFRATGEEPFHAAFRLDLLVASAETPLVEHQSHDQQWAAWTYALTERPEADPALRDRLRRACVLFARTMFVETAAKRTLRHGGNLWRPLTWGFGSVPDLMAVAVAQRLAPAKEFAGVMQTTCDFMLGANPLNMCWITGMGSHSPEMVFHPDSWYSPKGPVIAPGIVPEGPYRFEGEGDPKSGPWDVKFVHRSAYPPASEWPPLELYFEARTCYPMNEFTTSQLAVAAASYGGLCAPASGRIEP